MPNCGCNDYSRTQLLRRAAAEAGQRTAGDRAGHADAGGHGPHAALVRLARHRPRAVGLRRRQPRAEGVRGGHRGRRCAGARPSACSCRSSCREVPTRSRCSRRRARIPQYAANRPTLALPARPGHSAHRGHLAALAPLVRRARGALRRGQGQRDAGGRLRRREPVALHEPPLLGGRRDEPVRPLGLARPLPRPARRGRQPAPGPRPRLGPPAGAGRARRARSRRWRSPTTTTSGRPASGARCRTRCSTRSATSASWPRATPASARRARRWLRPGACATSSRRSRAASPAPPG